MSAEKLPEGWVETYLSEICSKPQYGYTTKSSPTGNVKFLRTTDITKGTVDWSTVPYCLQNPDDILKYQLQDRDIVISRAGSVGFSFLVKNPPNNVVFASYLIRFKPFDNISELYLKRFLESGNYWVQLASMSAGNALQNVNAQKLSTLIVPIPPLAEQKIIAEKLDTLLAQVDSTKARLEQIPQILKRFRQAVLAAAVTGRLTKENKDFRTKKVELDNYKILIPEDWSEAILNNIINTQRPLCYGVVQPGDDIKDGIELIRVCDINDGEVDLNHLRKISKEIDLQYKRSKVRKNDILVTIVGAIGRIGIVREDINVNIARAVARISPECNIIVPMFLHIWLSSPVMQTWLVQSSKEVARKTLNLKDLKNAFVPLPSIEEQHEIVRRVEQLFAYADTIEKQVNNALARVNNLTQSILAKAFRGELTAQWRAENPELISGENSAAALLEKIKAERAASGGKKASRKKS
ncbi:restriction endonuclease subunit S [Escherichia marmotae]|uniref:restriction endonuclease subunit S n=1 Tax=Escherichia marmotae TaxID=1499973 RepID=UPI002E1B17C2|nr:restriction endonuclease subunit S [Escherichia marmotae]